MRSFVDKGVDDAFIDKVHKVFGIVPAKNMAELQANLQTCELFGHSRFYNRELAVYIPTVTGIDINTHEGQDFIFLLQKYGGASSNDDAKRGFQATLDLVREKLWDKDNLDSYRVDAGALPKDSSQILPLYMALEEFNLFPNQQYREDLAVLAINALLSEKPSWERDRTLKYEIIFRQSYKKPLHPALVAAAQTAYVADAVHRFGKDYGSAKTHKKFMDFVRAELLVDDSFDRATRYKTAISLLDRITKGIEAQPVLCAAISDMITAGHVDAIKIYDFAIIGAKSMVQVTKQDENVRLGCIDFLASPLSKESLTRAIAIMRQQPYLMHLVQRDMKRETDDKPSAGAWGDFHAELVMSQYLSDMHRNFWNLRSHERVVIMDNLLLPGSELIKGQAAADEAFRKAFELVGTKLFPTGKVDNEIAADFVKHFLAQAREEERSLLLAGLMAAAEQSAVETRTGEKLRVVFSVMGPAYVKLGQQLGSFLGARQEPEARQMAKDLSGLKSEAQPEPLWEYYPRLLRTLPHDIARRINRFVCELGSASINKAFKVRMDATCFRFRRGVSKVLLLERENALPLANAGFDHIARTLHACEHPFWNEHRQTAIGLVEETQKTFGDEVNPDVFAKQMGGSQEIYAGRTIHVRQGWRGFSVTLKPVTADAYGTDDRKIGFKVLDSAEGLHFDELPESTAQQKAVKQAAAKAYATFELSRILSGKIFDSDRHGRQMRVLVRGRRITLGLFDFGCMLTTPPNAEQRAQLADAVTYIVKGQLNKLHNGKAVSNDPQQALTDFINTQQAAGADTSFLRTARRGIVALGDFFQHITPEETRQVFETALTEARNPLINQKLMELTMQGKGTMARIKTYMGWIAKKALRLRRDWFYVTQSRLSGNAAKQPILYVGQQRLTGGAEQRPSQPEQRRPTANRLARAEFAFA